LSEPLAGGHPGGPPLARELHQRARRAIRLLLGRQAVLQAVGLIGGVVVARVLGPGPLGVFGIALFVVTLAGFIADAGTRAALIQQADAVTEEQLATCFGLQQLLVTALVALLLLAAPVIASLYGRAPPELAWLIRLLAFDLYLRSWRSLSEIRLERDLRYRELAVSDVVGSVGYQVVAVGLVLAGWGVQSLALAMLVGNAARVPMLYRAAPWPLRFGVPLAAARRLLRRSLPLQAGRVVGLAPGWITPTLVAALIGPEAVGLLSWASTLGRKPLEGLENVVRVSLPHFARLQHDAPEVERVLVRYAVASLLACGLWFAVIAIAGHDLVALVYTERWLPALPALILYAGSAMIASLRTLAATALTGMGHIRFGARVSAAAALVAVGTSIVLVLRIGFLGVPLGQLAGILVATPWLLRGLRPGAPGRVLRGALAGLRPLGLGIAAGGLCQLLLAATPARGFVTAAVVSAAYLAVAWRAGPEWLRAAAREELALPALRPRRPDTP
jgi:O-antigen/teichoic acid export membrane protein